MFCNITMCACTVCVCECVCVSDRKYIPTLGWMGDLHGDLSAWTKCQFWKCVVIPGLLREKEKAHEQVRHTHLRGVGVCVY